MNGRGKVIIFFPLHYQCVCYVILYYDSDVCMLYTRKKMEVMGNGFVGIHKNIKVKEEILLRFKIDVIRVQWLMFTSISTFRIII